MSTRKITAAFTLILVILLAFTACSVPGSDARLVLPIDNEPPYLDPQIVSDPGSKMIMLNCLEGLVTYDYDGVIVPAAAESYTVSSDGLTYSFKLREDGIWRVTKSAGVILGEDYENTFDTRVTAADFVFALRRALEPATVCPDAGLLMNIKNAEKVNSGKVPSSKLGVSAEGDYMLKITLERRDDDLLSALTTAACLPCKEDYFIATGGRYGLSTAYMIYNGPFYISNWAEGTAITIRRNYLYHNLGDDKIESEVMPQSVYFSFNNEQSTREKKLKDETYHIAPLTDAQASDLEGNKRVSVNPFDSSLISLVFNCSDEYMSCAALRRSFAYGIDYGVFSSYGARPQSIIPSAMRLNGEALGGSAIASLFPHSASKAGKEYAKALDKLEITRLNLTLLCDENDETLARTMIQSLQSAFGVSFGIDVEPVDSLTLKTRIESGEYQLALYKLRFKTSIAKSALGMFSASSKDNIFSFSSKKYEKLLRKVYTAGSASIEKAIIEAENCLVEKSVFIPLASDPTYLGQRAKCTGVTFSPGGETALFKTALYS